MKTIPLVAGPVLLSLSLSGCAHWPADFHSGYYVQRSQTNYEIVVASAAEDPVDYFYHGAYYICLKEHQSGFEIVSEQIDQMGSVRGTVTCKGAPDEFLQNKYKNSNVKTEPSDFMAPGSFHYQIM